MPVKHAIDCAYKYTNREDCNCPEREAFKMAEVRSGNEMRKYPHYFKHCPFREIDIYRVLLLWQVADPNIGHAIKKLLVAGGRGVKDSAKDVQEAIDALQRWQEMRKEEESNG